MPRSLHADAGDAAFTNRRRSSSNLFITDLCQLALLLVLLIILPWCYALYDLPQEFAVQLEPTDHQQGLVVINTSSSPAAAAAAGAFDATLHASNRRATERCYHHGDAAVTYGGFTVASGRVPGFCVPGKGRREVPLVLARTTDDDAGVMMGLPEHLRARAADEAGKVGALELEVQIALFHDGGGGDAASTASSGSSSTPSRRMWCTARVGSGAQPPEVALCTVFAPQNWFDFGA